MQRKSVRMVVDVGVRVGVRLLLLLLLLPPLRITV
jgi:hypothetical protein